MLKALFNLTFPNQCLLCHCELGSKTQLCRSCFDNLTRFSLPVSQPNLLLRPDIQRLFKQIEFEQLFAVGWYQSPFDTWLSQLKFHNKIYLRTVLSQLIQSQLQLAAQHPDWHWPDIITFMPLHHKRLLQRGFNQVVQTWQPALAFHSEYISSIVIPELLQRTKFTKAQTKLSAQQRQKNLQSAFTTNFDLNNKTVAIIDDVITTGTTINQASHCLKQAGAAEVWAWVTCITPLNGD